MKKLEKQIMKLKNSLDGWKHYLEHVKVGAASALLNSKQMEEPYDTEFDIQSGKKICTLLRGIVNEGEEKLSELEEIFKTENKKTLYKSSRPKGHITVNRASQMSGIPKPTLYRYIRKGRLSRNTDYKVVGNYLYLNMKNFRNWLKINASHR